MKDSYERTISDLDLQHREESERLRERDREWQREKEVKEGT